MLPKTTHKICIATSTRADWGLLSPLARALQARSDIDLTILATNMHLLDRYGHTIDEIVADGFQCIMQVVMDDTDDREASKVRAMAQCMAGTADVLQTVRPEMLVILGDRYEMLAVASAAEVMKVPIVHIAGGEISEGAIDDSIRHAITKLSTLHLTATDASRHRVIQMGESPERVINTGAIGVWNITHQPLMTLDQLSTSLDFEIVPKRTFLVTYHPATLDGKNTAAGCRAMLDALDGFPDYRVIITYPNNDAGSVDIINEITAYAERNKDRVLLIKSLGMRRYLSVLPHMAAVIGNSSSGIVEVPSMGVPTVDIGIRQRGRISGPSVIHCGDTTAQITTAIESALSPTMQALASKRQNPYAKDDTLELMVNAIINADVPSMSQKKFYDLKDDTVGFADR